MSNEVLTQPAASESAPAEVAASESAAVTPAPAAPPSVHVRAVITWIAIFPLVAIALTLLTPVSEGWHPVLRALVLTVIVVPSAVYLVVPRLMALHHHVVTRRR